MVRIFFFFFFFPNFFFFFSVGKVVRYNTALARFRDNAVVVHLVLHRFLLACLAHDGMPLSLVDL